MKNRSAFVVLLIACSMPLLAQWPTYTPPGVPRDAQGRMQLEARAPRAANGKPDLSGNWVRGDRDPLPQELAGVVSRGTGDSGAVVVEPRKAPFPPDPNAPPPGHFF